jgi:hypothetical protein
MARKAICATKARQNSGVGEPSGQSRACFSPPKTCMTPRDFFDQAFVSNRASGSALADAKSYGDEDEG